MPSTARSLTAADAGLSLLLLAGLLAVGLLPAAQGSHPWIGWWPLWLVGMPLSAWLAHHVRRVTTARGTTLAAPPRRRPRRSSAARRPSRRRAQRWLAAALHLPPT